VVRVSRSTGLLYTLIMDQQSLQAAEFRTPAYGYEAPGIVCHGSLTDLTMGVGGAGTDSIENAPLGPVFS
jgi:hypothetical protein